ncbi:hypothetical protein Btru_040989 [Bulinus truncatus]|nr:hypothetical protein Btru_040989 [Bulinus truncatus]
MNGRNYSINPEKGKHEVQMVKDEAQLEEAAATCDKQHCHQDMIPVDNFTIENLPVDYRLEDIFYLAKSIAKLTVKLKVTYVSDNRPMYIPKTELPYPLYDKRGSADFLSTGSGRVCDVVKQSGSRDETCKCSKCKVSPRPSKTWWHIKIFTATAVVHDDKEANQTSCTFFDEGGTRDSMEISGCKCVWLDVEGDLCLMQITSCDEELCEGLFSTIKTFNNLWKKLKKTSESLNYKDNKEKLVIIVSHPHGSQKKISIGRGVEIGAIFGLRYSKYIYDAPTCPGSSGGPVYFLGNDWFQTEFVHSGYRHDVHLANSSPVDSAKYLAPLGPENISVHFTTVSNNSSENENIFFTSSSSDGKSDRLAGSEHLPQSEADSDLYSELKGYSTRWY